MGSTITVGKHVSAFRALDGTIYFALFEKLYESNCHPHSPRWSCAHFGSLDSALKSIFDRASSCEGGMLRGPSARMTPENYIAHWLRLLKAPVDLPDRRVTLATGESYRYAFSLKTCGDAARVFAEDGFPAEAAEIEAGRAVDLSLHAHARSLSRLSISPWKVLDAPYRMDGPARPDLGYSPRQAKAYPLPAPEVYKIGAHEHIMRDAEGLWRTAGWAYDLVGRYMQSLAAEERALPGSYRAKIEAYRAAIEGARQIPPGTTVTIDPPSGAKWGWTSAESFKTWFESGAPFSLPAEDAIASNVAYAPRERVTWNLPSIPDQIAA